MQSCANVVGRKARAAQNNGIHSASGRNPHWVGMEIPEAKARIGVKISFGIAVSGQSCKGLGYLAVLNCATMCVSCLGLLLISVRRAGTRMNAKLLRWSPKLCSRLLEINEAGSATNAEQNITADR